MPTRRDFIAMGAAAALAPAAFAAERKFTMAFTPGSIGVKTDQEGAVTLAAKYGFESVQPFADDLAKGPESELKTMPEELKKVGLAWAAAGLPVNYRDDEAGYREGLKTLRTQAPVYEKAGVTRMGTWIKPMHDDLTYLSYFKQIARRVREMAAILADHNIRLGLEYVGTPSLRIRGKHQFVHSMAETKELIAESGASNVGFVLDSWHWFTAQESKVDLLTLKNEDIVSADLNDAPAGLELIEQQDNTRELPAATGVIPIRDFLSALVEIGYDGPIRPEPFNKRLNAMENDEAAKTAGAAMKKAFALV